MTKTEAVEYLRKRIALCSRKSRKYAADPLSDRGDFSAAFSYDAAVLRENLEYVMSTPEWTTFDLGPYTRAPGCP